MLFDLFLLIVRHQTMTLGKSRAGFPIHRIVAELLTGVVTCTSPKLLDWELKRRRLSMSRDGEGQSKRDGDGYFFHIYWNGFTLTSKGFAPLALFPSGAVALTAGAGAGSDSTGCIMTR